MRLLALGSARLGSAALAGSMVDAADLSVAIRSPWISWAGITVTLNTPIERGEGSTVDLALQFRIYRNVTS